MTGSEEAAARRAVREAQKQYEREQRKSSAARRKAFVAAQKAGLSLRQIAEETGMHHSHVANVINGK